MSDRITENPTPTVQVQEVGLPEQTEIVKVLAVAGAAGAAIAGIIAMLTEKDEQPPTKTESARAYLQSALETAKSKDLAKASRKERKRAAKNLKRAGKQAVISAEDVGKDTAAKARESAKLARGEFNSFLTTLKDGGHELERLAEEFAESTLMSKLREFGEEAKVLAEQGKVKSAEAAQKAQAELIPQAMDAARQAKETGKEKVAVVADKAKTDLIPTAQKVTADVGAHARDVAGSVSADAEKLLSEAALAATEKSKQAGTAVQRGGRETRSLLLWLSLAGILIFTVFLDEEQQQKLKEIAVEVFGEARDMYSDMKGDKHSA